MMLRTFTSSKEFSEKTDEESHTLVRAPSGRGVDQYTTDVASVYDSSYISIRLMYPQYGTELFSFLLSAFQGLFLWEFWKDFLMCNTCRGRVKPPNPDIAGKLGLESVSLPQSVCISAPAPS